MLILTRKIGQSIILNDNIELIITGVQGFQVRLGFIAPEDVPIHRKEIWQKIKKEQLLLNE